MNKDDLLLLVGRNLRKYRNENKLTQEQLAEKAGISTPFYANLERGKRSMSVLTLRELANSLNVSVDYLLNEDNPINSIKNLEILLSDKPDSFIAFIEKMIRLCVSEFINTGTES